MSVQVSDIEKLIDSVRYLAGPGRQMIGVDLDRLEQAFSDLLASAKILRETLKAVRNHPKFDAGGPFADMMDQAIRGEVPYLLIAADHLAQGVAPPKQETK